MLRLSEYIQRKWYQPKFSAYLLPLLPLATLFKCLAYINKMRTSRHQIRHDVPVWVVGNVSVGGTGKTPVTIALVNHCQNNNISVGIVSRGYGGSKGNHAAYLLNENTTAAQSGDEPLLMFKRLQCPVAIGSNRNQAITALKKTYPRLQLIISDDGLQHYAMHRDLEIAVVDGDRGLGNQQLLPAGPLRELPARLNSVDLIIHNGDMSLACEKVLSNFTDKLYGMQLTSTTLLPLHLLAKPSFEASNAKGVNAPEAGQTIHAVAGIGNPPRFFKALRALGFQLIEHSFPDHHQYQASDLNFPDKHAIIMTEKDAIKCTELKLESACYYLPVEAKFTNHFDHKLDDLLVSVTKSNR